MRTHTNGELTLKNVGEEVTLTGWVQKTRNLGGLLFVDLRDRYGVTQLLARPQDKIYSEACKLKSEYVIKVTGTVSEREAKNKSMPTGDIEIIIKRLSILSTSLTPPFLIQDDTDALEEFRLKYRYLDLRRPVLQQNIMIRHKIMMEVRKYFDSLGFLEIETPTFGRSTPEGARDYLVPSRVHPGKFYALPQSPQLYKQLLMVAGFDKYFQIARCYRDEDLRADRQMEFTQIDVEMSFITEEDIYSVIEGMMVSLFQKVLNKQLKAPFKRLRYDDSMERFGTDKPDTRFGMELTIGDDTFKKSGIGFIETKIKEGGTIKGIVLENKASVITRKDITRYEEIVRKNKGSSLIWFKNDTEISSSLNKFLTPELNKKIIKDFNLKQNDVLFLVLGRQNEVDQSLGALRKYLGTEFGLIDETKTDIMWITDWPSFEYSETENKYVACHHPFTSLKEESKKNLLKHPEKCYSVCYDLVLNGYELGSGSIRIHNEEDQKAMFKALGLTEEDQKEKFGFFTEALKYGTPPHGGIGLGLDRLAMIFANAKNLRDVIAFPKNAASKDPMSDSPSEVSKEQLDLLKIKIDV